MYNSILIVNENNNFKCNGTYNSIIDSRPPNKGENKYVNHYLNDECFFLKIIMILLFKIIIMLLIV